MLGASLPRRMLGAGGGNEAGHWEPERLIAYHDQLLAELGSDWHDWKTLDLKAIPSAQRDQIATDIADIVAEDFGDSPLFVIKEPRIARFAPFFCQALARRDIDVSAIVAFRNPLDVMDSLIARQTIWPADHDRSDAALLWLSHMLGAEFAARDRSHAFVSYESVMADPVAAMHSLVKNMGLNTPIAVAEAATDMTAFISDGHRHHAHRPDEVLLDPQLSGWVADTYSALRDLEANRNLSAARETLDRVRREFHSAMPVLTTTAAARRKAFADARTALEKASQSEAECQKLMSERSALTGELERTRSEYEIQLAAKEDKLQSTVASEQELRHSHAVAQAALSEARDQAQDAIGRAEAIEARFVQAQAEMEDLRRDIAQAHDDTKQARQSLAEAKAREAELSAALHQLKTDHAAELQAARDAMDARLSEKNAEVNSVIKQASEDRQAAEARQSESAALASRQAALLEQRNKQIEQQQARLAQARDEISALSSESASSRAQSEALLTQLHSTQAELTQRAADLEGARKQHDEIHSRLQQNEATLAIRTKELELARQANEATLKQLSAAHSEYRNSTSWKITAPLRGTKVAVRAVSLLPERMFRGIRALPAVVRFGGGLLPSIGKAATVYRTEGTAGVTRRIRYAVLMDPKKPSRPRESTTVSEQSNRLQPAQLSASQLSRSASDLASHNHTTKALSTGNNSARKPDFVARSPELNTQANFPVKAIAFYLPQYHPIPENDEWWGKGFTEWHNVVQARPQFPGHYQPHIPGEMGYYDLRSEDVFKNQVELAQLYGVGGFCFYFYWFGGKTLLEMPLKRYLSRPELTLPFCLCWANENWTRTWDGLEKDILIQQNHSAEDDINFIEHLSEYLVDPRYIRVNGKPLVVVYRPNILPNAKETADRWRDWCRKNGVGEIYLAYTQSFESVDPRSYGFDAAIEFPPNNSGIPNITSTTTSLDGSFQGQIYDWRELVTRSENYTQVPYTLFRSVNPGWDNTARKKDKGNIILHSSPDLFQRWVANSVRNVISNSESSDERLIFVNAWNEWAEGAHLEPDQRYGYAYLNALRNGLLGKESEAVISSSSPVFKESLAVILHAYYLDVLEDILDRVRKLTCPFHLFLTVPTDRSTAARKLLAKHQINGTVIECQNRGRDVLPFLKALRLAQGYGYEIILKLHTKKSLHRVDGDAWRDDIYEQLTKPDQVQHVIAAFKNNPVLGLVGPDRHIVSMDTYIGSNRKSIMELARHMGVHSEDVIMGIPFIAGTMFFARIAALEPLIALRLNDFDFDEEAGQTDGTLAHAIERAIAISCVRSGHELTSVESATSEADLFVNNQYAHADPSNDIGTGN